MKISAHGTLGLVFGLFIAVASQAQTTNGGLPNCRDTSFKVISGFQNSKVVQLKKTTQNNYKEQVLVKTYLVQNLPNTNNQYGIHAHFIVSLAEPTAVDFKAHDNLIEIAESLNDYTAPTAADLSQGPIYLCGEYATTLANGFPPITKFIPSTTGAMIHWTHLAGPNMDGHYSHPNGWIVANGKVFGSAMGKMR